MCRRAAIGSVELESECLRQEDRHLATCQWSVRTIVPASAAAGDAGRVERLDVLEEGVRRRHVVEARAPGSRADLEGITDADGRDRGRTILRRRAGDDEVLMSVVVDGESAYGRECG